MERVRQRLARQTRTIRDDSETVVTDVFSGNGEKKGAVDSAGVGDDQDENMHEAGFATPAPDALR